MKNITGIFIGDNLLQEGKIGYWVVISDCKIKHCSRKHPPNEYYNNSYIDIIGSEVIYD